MSEVVNCPACGEPVPAPAADEEKNEQLAQLREVVRLQRERLDAAAQRVRDLEETLRQVTRRPGFPPAPPAAPPAPPGFPPPITLQGEAGAF